jgi:hypothetical protein
MPLTAQRHILQIALPEPRQVKHVAAVQRVQQKLLRTALGKTLIER